MCKHGRKWCCVECGVFKLPDSGCEAIVSWLAENYSADDILESLARAFQEQRTKSITEWYKQPNQALPMEALRYERLAQKLIFIDRKEGN